MTMNKELLNYVVEKANDMMRAPMCCEEARAAAQAWLDAIGTENEAAETKKFLDELAVDIMPIDTLLAFAGSDAGKQYFGEEAAQGIVVHGKEMKEAGAKYCDCPACAAAEAILAKKEEILQ